MKRLPSKHAAKNVGRENHLKKGIYLERRCDKTHRKRKNNMNVVAKQQLISNSRDKNKAKPTETCDKDEAKQI